MCVFFPHPLVLWSSSEWRVQGCVLAVWPTPSFSPLCLRLILHGCVSCSDSRFPDARFLGDWNSAPPLSTSSPLFPWERGPSLARLLHSLPSVVSLSPVWACWAPWRCRLALTELLGRAGGALLAGVLLWPLTCEPPATLGPPSPSVPAVLSASSSQWVWWLSPATSWRHDSLPLDLRIGSPTHLDFLGEPRGPSPVPFPRAQVLVQSWTPPDCPHSCLWTINQEWEGKYFRSQIRKKRWMYNYLKINSWKAVLPVWDPYIRSPKLSLNGEDWPGLHLFLCLLTLYEKLKGGGGEGVRGNII